MITNNTVIVKEDWHSQILTQYSKVKPGLTIREDVHGRPCTAQNAGGWVVKETVNMGALLLHGCEYLLNGLLAGRLVALLGPCVTS